MPYYILLLILLITAMDTDKIKIFGARVKVDGTGKLAELERAEKVISTSKPVSIFLSVLRHL